MSTNLWPSEMPMARKTRTVVKSRSRILPAVLLLEVGVTVGLCFLALDDLFLLQRILTGDLQLSLLTIAAGR